jgi:subtilisin family serine protease
LRTIGFTPDVALKWQNRVSGWIDPSRLSELSRLPVVRRVEGMPHKAPYFRLPGQSRANVLLRVGAAAGFGAFQPVFDTTQASVLRTAVTAAGQGAGQGLRIAIIDENFYLRHDAFTHLWQGGQIVDQWDFVQNKSQAVLDTLGNSHGAAVLSLLGGRTSTLEGLVPEAKFLLYVSENNASETYVEEDYLAAAIERAVDSGAQVISISLGYRYDYTDSSPDIPYASMNGRARPSSLAALGAARRGALLSIAMGNEGPTRPSGPTISAPADADSILSVGILDLNLQPCSYTGRGPTADGRVKPEVATAVSGCITPTANPSVSTGVIYQGGTSFAAPVVAGIAALLLQLHPPPDTSMAQKIRRAQSVRMALMASATNTLHPDSAAGYGLVRAGEAHRILSVSYPSQGAFVWDRSGPRVYMRWRPGLDFSAAQLWDMRGRALSVQSGSAGPVFWIKPGTRGAAGFYVFKVPLRTDSTFAW